MKMIKPRSIYARNLTSLKKNCRDTWLIHKTLKRTRAELKGYFSRYPFVMNSKQLPMKGMTLTNISDVFRDKSCRLSYKHKYILPENRISSSYHREALKCLDILQSSRSPFPFSFSEIIAKLLPFKIHHEISSPKRLVLFSQYGSYLIDKTAKPIASSLSRKPQRYLGQFQQVKSTYPQDTRNSSLQMRQNNMCGKLIYYRHIPRRELHISSILQAKSKSGKSSDCKPLEDICKLQKKECSEPCRKKNSGRKDCQPEQVQCEKRKKSQKRDNKKTQENQRHVSVDESPCIKPCFKRAKCEPPRTVPPSKMEYKKVTCPPSKFAIPTPCPLIPQEIVKDKIETKKIIPKKQICHPPPLPKPPCGPTILCPCPPPPKQHPGSCPCYKQSTKVTDSSKKQPCPKKKYSCPTGIHYCPTVQKTCEQKPPCDVKKKKEEPEC